MSSRGNYQFEFSCLTLIVVVAIVAIVAVAAIISGGSRLGSCCCSGNSCSSSSCSSSRRCCSSSTRGGGALAVRDDLLHPREETLHPGVHTWVLSCTATATADHSQQNILSILSNSEWSPAVSPM